MNLRFAPFTITLYGKSLNFILDTTERKVAPFYASWDTTFDSCDKLNLGMHETNRYLWVSEDEALHHAYVNAV